MRATTMLQLTTSAAMAMAVASCAFFKSGDQDDFYDDSPAASIEANAPGDNGSGQPTSGENPPNRQIVDDGLRFPDMLSLPSERELRRPPPQIATDDNSDVTARPPLGEPKE